jgi:acid phosphatase type 7
MFDLNRRHFLQSASLLAGYGSIVPLLGGPTDAQLTNTQPAFAPRSTFDPAALFLTWQHDPTTTMTVQWIGEQEADGLTRPIWYAKDHSEEWRSVPAKSRKFPLTERWIFRTELTGLEPDTDYRFRVGLDSAEQRFRTMPAKANNTIHFVSGGDSGIGHHAMNNNRVAAAQSPQFVVIGGDLAYENGTSPATFFQFIKNYAHDLKDDKGRLIPMLACVGNHEVNGGYGKTREKAPFFYAMFDGLFDHSGYAKLDFGDYLSLVLLDTGHTTPVKGAQTDWLGTTLKEREECPTLFVFNHVPAYPSFRPFALDGQEDGGVGADQRKFWCPLFERYNVDAVFEHHDHTFKRTHPMLDGRVNDNGIVYLGDGSWGKIRRPKTPQQRPYLAFSDETYHMSVHRIEGKERYHVALSDTGRVVDVCVTTKRSHRRTT